MRDDTVDLSRRGFAGAAGLLGLASLAAAGSPRHAAAAIGKPLTLDLSCPAGALGALAKVKGSRSGKPRLGSFTGQMIALAAGGQMRPVFGLRGISLSALHWMTDGGFEVATRELALYSDLTSGKPLGTFINPLNGRQVRAPMISATTLQTIRPEDALNFAWQTANGHARLEEPPSSVHEREHGPSERPQSRDATQATSWHVALDELVDSQSDCTVSVGETLRAGPWPTWMFMSEASGACLCRCSSRSGSGEIAELAVFQELRSHPFFPSTLWADI